MVGSPPSALDHDLHVLLEHARSRCARAPARRPGGSSSRSSSTNSAPDSRAICSSTGLGKTSEPKTAGTCSARIWSISRGDLLRARVAEVRGLDRADDRRSRTRAPSRPTSRGRSAACGSPPGPLATPCPDQRVELVEARLERVEVRGVVVGVGGIRLAEPVAHQLGVAQRVRRRSSRGAGWGGDADPRDPKPTRISGMNPLRGALRRADGN